MNDWSVCLTDLAKDDCLFEMGIGWILFNQVPPVDRERVSPFEPSSYESQFFTIILTIALSDQLLSSER